MPPGTSFKFQYHHLLVRLSLDEFLETTLHSEMLFLIFFLCGTFRIRIQVKLRFEIRIGANYPIEDSGFRGIILI